MNGRMNGYVRYGTGCAAPDLTPKPPSVVGESVVGLVLRRWPAGSVGVCVSVLCRDSSVGRCTGRAVRGGAFVMNLAHAHNIHIRIRIRIHA